MSGEDGANGGSNDFLPPRVARRVLVALSGEDGASGGNFGILAARRDRRGCIGISEETGRFLIFEAERVE